MNLEPVARPKSAEPWARVTARARVLQIVASAVPILAAAAAWFIGGMDPIVAILFVLLPLLLICVGWVGFILKGKRGIPDAILIVMTIFLGTFVMVLLMSVVWSLVEAGFSALSPHFIYQNNVYVTPTDGLEFGGEIGRAHV
jgi:hypothetical protein